MQPKSHRCLARAVFPNEQDRRKARDWQLEVFQAPEIMNVKASYHSGMIYDCGLWRTVSSNSQQPAARGQTGNFGERERVPRELALVVRPSGRLVGVSLEIHKRPGAVLEEGQVDVPFEEPSAFGLHHDRQLAMAARCGGGALEQRVIERGGHSLDSGLNFLRRRAEYPSVNLGQAR